MHELVSQYIEKKKAEKKERVQKEKAKKLIELGIYEKEFPADPNNFDYFEYDCYFYDEQTGSNKRYKRIPIEVSDEEYNEILKYSEETTTTSNSSNVIATIIRIFAWIIFIGGFILGCVCGNVEVGSYYSRTEFSIAIAMVYWGVSFAAGFSMLAFAEILDLLQKINNNTKLK